MNQPATSARRFSVRRRDGEVIAFDPSRIAGVIEKALEASEQSNPGLAQKLCDKVVARLTTQFPSEKTIGVETIQDTVETILIEEKMASTAKAFILYRQKRKEMREARASEVIVPEGPVPRIPHADKWDAMFAHQSKLSTLIGNERIHVYRDLLYQLKTLQSTNQLVVHPDNEYLGANELATSIYEKKYYLKDLAGARMENRPEDVFVRLAAFIAATETEPEKQQFWARAFYRHLYEGHFIPGGRVIAGAGDLYRLKTLANCFVSLIQDDNIESIYQTAYECARTYSYGGGIGVDISGLRPRDAIVHNAADHSTGSVSFMELYSLTTGLIGQSGRRGALMLTIDVKHPDVTHFIRVKKDSNWVTKQIVEQAKWGNKFNADQLAEIERQVRENTQVRFANISVKANDEFMMAVEEQNAYPAQTLLVYKKLNKTAGGPAIQKDRASHFSFGIPSRNTADYVLLETFESLETLNAFLRKTYSLDVDGEKLDGSLHRDTFGDYVLDVPHKDHQLAIRYAGDFMLYFNSPQTGEIKRLVKARDVWNPLVEGNYKTAEPGLIFWSTMSKYSPSNYVGRPIASTNPCVSADSLVSTSYGLERIDSMRASQIVIDQRTLQNGNSAQSTTIQSGTQLVNARPAFQTGFKDVYRLQTVSGYEVEATPDHRIRTPNGWKPMAELRTGDEVLIQSGEGRFSTETKLPFVPNNSHVGENSHSNELNLPMQWDFDLGLVLGWLTGDGFISQNDGHVGLVFSKADEEARQRIQPIFEKYANRTIKPTNLDQAALQIRSHNRNVKDYFLRLGVKPAGMDREVPATLFTAPEESVIGFLQGLFSSDGTIASQAESRNYARLNSSSRKLLQQVQLLLLNLGIKSAIFNRSTEPKQFDYTTSSGRSKQYQTSGINFELNISRENLGRFIEKIGFIQSRHQATAKRVQTYSFYREYFTEKVLSIEPQGLKEVWDITEPISHSFIANGFVVHNCGEVPLEDGGACNLGSLNLGRFINDPYTDQAHIDWARLKEATHALTRFLDNVVTWNENLNALPKQREAARVTRRLGLGVMGIADMLNMMGVGYDSDEGIETMGKVMEFIANQTYQASAELAEEKGSSEIFEYNAYAKNPFFQESLTEETRAKIRQKGLRNIAILSIAPTGTISNIPLSVRIGTKHYVGCSGGIEPIFSLYYTRRSESFGNVFFKVFHSTVQAYVDMNHLQEKVQQAPSLNDLRGVLPTHFFRTSHHIDPQKRVLVQSICQQFVDHSISSTINLSEDIEPEVISGVYLQAWKHKIKGLTVYRDGSRYPILSVETEKTVFQTFKEKTFKITQADGSTVEMRGDEVFALPSGQLTTLYHVMKAPSNIQTQNPTIPTEEMSHAPIRPE